MSVLRPVNWSANLLVFRLVSLLFAAAGHDLRRLRRRIWRSGMPGLLAARRAERISIAPPDIRAADPLRAPEIYAGRFALAGQIVVVGGEDRVFEMPQASADWRRELHSFSWLRHLRSAGTEVAAVKARSLVEEWLGLRRGGEPLAWEVETLTRRVIAWLSHAPMFLEGADSGFYARFMRSLNVQLAFLERAGSGGPHDLARLRAAIALAMAALCLPRRKGAVQRAGRRLSAELDAQVFADGGHISRDPGAIPEILLDLLPLRQTYLATATDPPERLISAVERMMPMIRFFRHRDGSLAHFNGMGATRTGELATLLAYDDVRGEPLKTAPHSGFERLTGLGATVIMDTGRPPPTRLSARAHAGCLSFEFSTNAGVIVTNCGGSRRLDSRWTEVCRSTAAHSTVTLNDASSLRFAARPWIVERLGPVVMAGPRAIGAERADDEEAQDIAASHDGYSRRFGIVHDRRLVLSADGGRLDGQDSFIAERARRKRKDDRFAIRFHLHPLVHSAMTASGNSVLLRVGSQEAWEFFAEGAQVSLEPSVYVNGPEPPRRCQQIVLAGTCRQQKIVVWSFIRFHQPPDDGDATTPESAPPEPGWGDLFKG